MLSVTLTDATPSAQGNAPGDDIFHEALTSLADFMSALRVRRFDEIGFVSDIQSLLQKDDVEFFALSVRGS